MNLGKNLSLTFLVLSLTSVGIRLISAQKCDPISERLLDANNIPIPDGSTCPVGNYCVDMTPPTVPPTGNCGPQLAYGSKCTKNAACDPDTKVEVKKFTCSRRPGAKVGTCGCLLDYYTDKERDDYMLTSGHIWLNGTPGTGCVKYVGPNRACNSNMEDVCATPSLICRARDGKRGDQFCLFPFGQQGDGEDCHDKSDCKPPKDCIRTKCACPEGQMKDPSNPAHCIFSYVGFGITCSDDGDCLPQWDIECNTLSKVCACTVDTVGLKIFEYFKQRHGHDRCSRVFDYGYACDKKGVIVEASYEHDCRRKNANDMDTNFICNDKLICSCEVDHFEYKLKRCVQKYAWHGQNCAGAGMDSEPAEFKCICIPGAILLESKKSRCEIVAEPRNLDETCDSVKLICNADLHLACTNGICKCVEDPAITFDEPNGICRFTNKRKDLRSGSFHSPPVLDTFLLGGSLVQIFFVLS